MQRVRVIPTLLLAEAGLVKTCKFRRRRYIGDPINAVKIFNDKEVDELVLLDIDAGNHRRSIQFEVVEEIVSEAFMPVAYGGGISSVDEIGHLLRSGIEKVILNTAAYQNPALIREASLRFGSQSIVVSIDAKRTILQKNRVFVAGGQKSTALTPREHALNCERLGAGEVLLTSIDREGSFQGYDCDLFRDVTSALRIPVIGNGGAGKISDFRKAVLEGGCSAVAAGSMFVYSAPNEGVLINYPTRKQLTEELWSELHAGVV